MVLLGVENLFSSLIAIGFLFGTVTHSIVAGDIIELVPAVKNHSSMGIYSEDMMYLMGYEEEKFGYKCRDEDRITSLQPQKTLNDARKYCDERLPDCKGIYSPNCLDTGEIKILCRGKPA